MTRALILCLALLSGCTMIDMHTPPPSDWPKLEVAYVTSSDLVPGCALMLSCANINFDTMRCTVYQQQTDLETREAAKEHEDKHCEGYDHIGSTALRDYWEQWKAGK